MEQREVSYNHMKSILPSFFPVTCHTDYVGVGTIFVAINGFKTDGLLYVPLALKKGATEIVVGKDELVSPELRALIESHGARLSYVADTRKALAELSAAAAGHPADKLTIIGVTGTKGKTTTSFLLKHMLVSAGYRTALVSTAGNHIEDIIMPANLTTPQPDYLHQFLKVCVDRGITHVVMEVAAQALSMSRVRGIFFDAMIFTNFGLEHLEFYDSLDSYFAAKCLLLDQRKIGAYAYINGDDSRVKLLSERYSDCLSFGQTYVDIKLELSNRYDLEFVFRNKNQKSVFSCPQLSGLFNMYNCGAAIGVLLDLGLDTASIQQGLLTFEGVPGRFEKYRLSNGAFAIIDYAHNPLSYEALLSELRLLTSQLTVVFGSGGNRDASRRPLMGAIAAEYADLIVITSDNPRTEDPFLIAQDICAGIVDSDKHKVIIELDRELAIQIAFEHSRQDSIIAVLGKGPDQYQEIGTQKFSFKEREIVQSL